MSDFFAKIRQAAARLSTMCETEPATEAELAALAERMRAEYGIPPSVTRALAIAGRPRRNEALIENW